jgi:hypothetical protein
MAQDAAPEVKIFPIDRAKFLAGSPFDLRVEALHVDPATASISLDVSGPNGPAQLLRGDPERTRPTADILAVTYPQLRYDAPGTYTITARVTSGGRTAQSTVANQVVVGSASGRQARNIIFFLGDGMGSAPITAARILSKGMTEGRYNGMLEMDGMDYRGMVTTSGHDSIATDSANSMSAYMCGHKSSVNAMGVYAASPVPRASMACSTTPKCSTRWSTRSASTRAKPSTGRDRSGRDLAFAFGLGGFDELAEDVVGLRADHQIRAGDVRRHPGDSH